MLFALFLHFLIVNYIQGLYKLQPEDGKMGEPNLLVEEKLAKKDYLYLYQFNRTSFAPSQAPLNQFIEGLLILMNVKFHRIANQFFLGSQSTGTLPFIQYNGEYFDGVENILKFLNDKHPEKMKKLKKYAKDEEVKKFALDFSFKILMKDRSRRLKLVSTNTDFDIENEEKEWEGLDFMLYDQGIREQMLPAIPNLIGRRNVPVGQFKLRELSRKFLTEYFDCSKSNRWEKCEAFNENGNVIGLTETNWAEFQNAMETYITGELQSVLITNSNGNASEEKLKLLLEQNKYEDGQSYAEIDEAELYNIFMEKLEELKIINRLEKTKLFLGGTTPSIGDMALFNILVQFFETPLNIPEFKQFFQPNRLNSDDEQKMNDAERKDKYRKYSGKNFKKMQEIFKSFYERMKHKLRIGGERWAVLTQKPWPMNYENIWREKFPNKFDGPYAIETDELNYPKFAGPFHFEIDELKNLLGNKNPNYKNLLNEIIENVKTNATELIQRKGIIKSKANWFKVGGKPITEFKLREMMLAEFAAYLCNLGTGKSTKLGEECRMKHAKWSASLPEDIKQKTRKIVYGTIVDYNDRLVRDKLSEETNRVVEIIKNDPENVEKYSSSTTKMGNEN